MIVVDVEQNSGEWLNYRIGIPTASDFKKLVTSAGAPSKSMKDYAMTLAGNRYAGKSLDSFEGNIHTERGHELEESAALAYSMDNDVDVEKVGFIMDDDSRYGCSPDRLVTENGLLEIKCCQAKGHIKNLMYVNKYGKAPTDYLAQVHGQMLVCERDWCDLMFYHPELPSRTIRVNADENMFVSLISQIQAVEIERDSILEVLNNA